MTSNFFSQVPSSLRLRGLLHLSGLNFLWPFLLTSVTHSGGPNLSPWNLQACHHVSRPIKTACLFLLYSQIQKLLFWILLSGPSLPASQPTPAPIPPPFPLDHWSLMASTGCLRFSSNIFYPSSQVIVLVFHVRHWASGYSRARKTNVVHIPLV